MRVSELFETIQSKEEINRLLKKHFIIGGKIEYHDDGSISVDGNVGLIDKLITHLPVKFRKVGGNFQCNNSKLTSLDGSPQEVGGYFSCVSTNIISLKGGPKKVGSDFYCYNTEITSLEGAPEFIGSDFYCSNTPFYDQLLVDENTQISAVKYLPKQFIQLLNDANIKITQSVQIVAVDTDPKVIQYIKNPTRMAQLTAVKKNPKVIKFIKNPDPLVLQYLAKSK